MGAQGRDRARAWPEWQDRLPMNRRSAVQAESLRSTRLETRSLHNPGPLLGFLSEEYSVVNGDPIIAVPPSSANRALMKGSPRMPSTSALILATMSAGVLAGTPMPLTLLAS